MKIQEMKSGILHLNKKVENEGRENFFETRLAGDAIGAAVTDVAQAVASGCELDEPRWCVVSFDRREAGSLTYADAVAMISKLDELGVPGLCIITDDAAANIGS